MRYSQDVSLGRLWGMGCSLNGRENVVREGGVGEIVAEWEDDAGV